MSLSKAITMLTAEPSSAPSSTPASASTRLCIHTVALKLPEFWANYVCVWFAQTETQFAVRGLTCSLTKFYFCTAALGCADTAQVVDLIEFPSDELPYESLKERLTKLHALNPFQRYQAFMLLTLATDEKPYTLVGKMYSLLPQSSQGWIFPVKRFLSPSKHQDPLDERRYLWSSQTCC